jgi:hypothetical protein
MFAAVPSTRKAPASESGRYTIRDNDRWPPQKIKTEKNSLIAGDFWVDFGGPAIYAAGHGFCVSDTLCAEPIGYVQAAHSVVAVENDVLVGVQLLQIRGNRAHRNEFGAFNAALCVFPWLANVHEQEFVAAVETRFYFLWSNFKIAHRFIRRGLY